MTDEYTWHPEYAEYYWTVETKTLNRLENRKHLYLAVHQYLWVDIDDDFEYLKNGLVFKTEEEAMNAAERAWEKMHESTLESDS